MANKKPRTVETKEEVVLRLLQGEDAEAVSREIGFRLDELDHWLQKYMSAGRQALNTADRVPFTPKPLPQPTPTWGKWNQQGTWLPE